MVIHHTYPPRLMAVRDDCLGVGALIIERKGALEIRLDGMIIVIAYRTFDVWMLETANGLKVAIPADEQGERAAPPVGQLGF